MGNLMSAQVVVKIVGEFLFLIWDNRESVSGVLKIANVLLYSDQTILRAHKHNVTKHFQRY